MEYYESVVQASPNRNFVILRKDVYTSVVYITGTKCLIVSVDFESQFNSPFVSYVFEGRSVEETYQKYLHLIGKLTLKSNISKYFGCPIWEEHCINGFSGTTTREEWEQLAKDVLKMISE